MQYLSTTDVHTAYTQLADMQRKGCLCALIDYPGILNPQAMEGYGVELDSLYVATTAPFDSDGEDNYTTLPDLDKVQVALKESGAIDFMVVVR